MVESNIYKFQKNEFKAEIVRRGLSLSAVAKAINIDTASLYRKMTGKSDFYRSEIQKLRELLQLSDEDMLRIFLPPMLRKRRIYIK